MKGVVHDHLDFHYVDKEEQWWWWWWLWWWLVVVVLLMIVMGRYAKGGRMKRW